MYSSMRLLFLSLSHIHPTTRRASRKLSSDVELCLEQAAASDARVYNFSLITEERKWVQVSGLGGGGVNPVIRGHLNSRTLLPLYSRACFVVVIKEGVCSSANRSCFLLAQM